MGGSSSQPHMEQPMSPTHSFPTEDMYSLQYSNSFQHTVSFQLTAREDSSVEVAALPPKSKPTRGRKKKTAQNEDASRSTAWTNEEEIKLCKCWVHVFENSSVGNARRESGFWTEDLRYLENKTKAYGRRTYDMMNGKWKTVRPNVAQFCGVYANVMRRAQTNGAGDEDYYAMALLDYKAEHGMTFTLRHG
nr:hypothetical protein [Tanacetum cinerariifolium]